MAGHPTLLKVYPSFQIYLLSLFWSQLIQGSRPLNEKARFQPTADHFRTYLFQKEALSLHFRLNDQLHYLLGYLINLLRLH